MKIRKEVSQRSKNQQHQVKKASQQLQSQHAASQCGSSCIDSAKQNKKGKKNNEARPSKSNWE
jgi:hypothetical protein